MDSAMDVLRLKHVSYDCVMDETFLRLWRAANVQDLSREEFEAMPMPEGADPDEVWEAISKLREWIGFNVGPNEDRSISLWANLSQASRSLAHRVIKRSGETSLIGRYVAAIGYKDAFTEAKIDSIKTALGLDGMQLDYESVRALLMEESLPHDKTELLVVNYEHLIEDEVSSMIAGYSNTRPRNVRALFSALANGVIDMQSTQWNMKVLANLDACLSRAGRASEETMFCDATYIWGAGHGLSFVSKLQVTFTSLLRKIYFIRNGYTNLSLVSLSSHLHIDEIPQDATGSVDVSSSVDQVLLVIDERLTEMESSARSYLQRIESVRSALNRSTLFNLRQKEVLVQMLIDRKTILDYDSLAEQFQVSYNTVRTDMAKLVSMGLLQTSLDGHRLVLNQATRFVATLEHLVCK